MSPGSPVQGPERLKRLGLLLILFLALLLHLVIFAVDYRDQNLLSLSLSGMGMVMGVLLMVLYGLRLISIERVSEVLLWFAVAWNALAMFSGVLTAQQLDPTIYVSHLVLVVMVFTMLPVRHAASYGLGSLALLLLLTLTRQSVDWVLLNSTVFTAALISYMTMFGQAVAPEKPGMGAVLEQALDPMTGLLTRPAALERLRALRRRVGTQARSGVIELLAAEGANQEFYGPAAHTEVLRGLGHRLHQMLKEPDFACRWDEQTFMVVWHDAAQRLPLAQVAELPFRDGWLPIRIYSGAAYFHESPELQGVIALAEVRLEENRKAAQSTPAQPGRK